LVTKVTVKAPASTANLGPGFDVFGLAINAFFDEITLRKARSGISIVADDNLPKNPNDNTAGLVVSNMKRRFKIKDGIEIKIKKGIPAGFGMGSSAASAAAAAVAFDKLFNLKLDQDSLVWLAGYGEKASAGTIHYDNVAASVLGGFVIVKADPLKVIKVAPPTDLRMCVAIPTLDVPRKKTEFSRKVIPKRIRLSDSILNLSNASAVVAGFMAKDTSLIGRSVVDVIVEPARKHMIPGFDQVKKNALKAGAMGVAISGAGPSVIAFASSRSDMARISKAMSRGFSSARIGSRTVICKPSKGAASMKK